MKQPRFIVACASVALAAASATGFAQQAAPHPSGMAGMQAAKPAQAQGIGVVKAIDIAKGTITLQHQAIATIGWPAMTMTFKADPPALLQKTKVGEQVRFTMHPAGMASTVTAIAPAQP